MSSAPPPFSLEHPNRPEIMNASLPQVSELYAGMRAVMTMRKLFEKMMRFQMGIAPHPALWMSNECQLLGNDLLACSEQYTHSANSNESGGFPCDLKHLLYSTLMAR